MRKWAAISAAATSYSSAGRPVGSFSLGFSHLSRRASKCSGVVDGINTRVLLQPLEAACLKSSRKPVPTPGSHRGVFRTLILL